jgi:hypothetical protein
MYNWISRLFISSNNEKKSKDNLVSSDPASSLPASSVLASRDPIEPPQEVLNPVRIAEDLPEQPASPKALSVSWMQRNSISVNFTNWMFEGSESSDLFVNSFEKEILAALEKIVKSKDSGANLVRRMPGVVPQLLQSLRTDNFSGAELAKKISNDVVLVAGTIH